MEKETTSNNISELIIDKENSNEWITITNKFADEYLDKDNKTKQYFTSMRVTKAKLYYILQCDIDKNPNPIYWADGKSR